MSIDHIVMIVIGFIGAAVGLYALSEVKAYRARRNLIDKLLDKQLESLKVIASRLGVTELEAVDISINRTYFHLVHGDGEYDFPTAEQIKAMGGSPSTMDITKTQLYKLVFGKGKTAKPPTTHSGTK